MGKKKQGQVLGKSIIRDRFQKKNKIQGESFIHTSELNDGYNWGRLNLQSVTEQSTLDDFLATAELAGTEFTAEKLNIQFVDPVRNSGLLSKEEEAAVSQLHKQHADLIRIPRRPAWTKEMSASKLDQLERQSFLDWRRQLASLQEVEGIVMTPYEKNLDFWRQLWRVIERSDVVVQIVDARNPLLFYCEDLETYVTEVSKNKVSLVLINKADYLTDTQRSLWAEYFSSKGVKVAFWSALQESESQEKADDKDANDQYNVSDSDGDEDVDDEVSSDSADCDSNYVEEVLAQSCTGDQLKDKLVHEWPTDNEHTAQDHLSCKEVTVHECSVSEDKKVHQHSDSNHQMVQESLETEHKTVQECSASKVARLDTSDNQSDCNKTVRNQLQTLSMEEGVQTGDSSNCDKTHTTDSVLGGNTLEVSAVSPHVKNSCKIYSGEELLEMFQSIHTGDKEQPGVMTVGMIGYPNVGKSSTINAILRMKKVPVSATPGRTKHFQTLYVDNSMMLCDCPGLVFPSFVSTKADLVTSGVLPIDQMRDHVPPVSLVCRLIPRQTLENTYGIMLPMPGEGEDTDRSPTADELLNSYGYMRGFMTSRGLPDCPRTARYILKDFVNGRLLYCCPPPGVDAAVFQPSPAVASRHSGSHTTNSTALPTTPVSSRVDREFFSKMESRIHNKTGVPEARSGGIQSGQGGSTQTSMTSLAGKPWKKHNNRGKKEKLRRVYKHLDD